MKWLKRQLTVYLLLAAMSLGILTAVQPAYASRKGRANTARALTGIAAYHLVKGHTGETLLFGSAAYYAWQKAKKSKHHKVHHHRHLRHQHARPTHHR